MKAYGNECQHKKYNLSEEPCKGNLHIIHVNHDGLEHRATMGGQPGAGTMARFVREVIRHGSKTDKSGKTWYPSDFGTLCEKHHRTEYDHEEASKFQKKRMEDPEHKAKLLEAMALGKAAKAAENGK
jgi:hypothetical protein